MDCVPIRTPRKGSIFGIHVELTGQGGPATQMFTAVSRISASGTPEMPKLLEVLKQNGITVTA
jgi:hypothetical protein